MFIENILGYEVVRKKIKNINLRVRSDGSVYISVPLYLDNYYIENFILSKKEWIEYNIKKFNEINKIKNQNNMTNRSKFKFLGNYYTINILKIDKDIAYIENNDLIVKTLNEEEENIKKIIEIFLYRECLKIISPLVEKWKNIMHKEFNRLIFNKIKGKWGYCNYNKKIIAFNIELITRSIFEIEYVIIHELAHLKHPNHSINFYRYVESYMKDYKKAENMLKNKI